MLLSRYVLINGKRALCSNLFLCLCMTRDNGLATKVLPLVACFLRWYWSVSFPNLLIGKPSIWKCRRLSLSILIGLRVNSHIYHISNRDTTSDGQDEDI